MESSTADKHALTPWAQLVRLLLLLAIPGAAVLVARYRPSWLLRALLATWRVPVGINLIWFPCDLEGAPGVAAVETATFGVLTGLSALWLHLGRGHPVFSRPAVQFGGAVAAFAGGMALVAFAATLG